MQKKTPKNPNPPRERLQPWHGQSIASPSALPRALPVPCPHALVWGRRETAARGGKSHAGGQDEGGKAAGSEAPGPGGVSPAPLAASPWSRPRHRHVPRSRSAAAAQTGNPPAAPSRWPLPPPCWGGGADSGEDGDVFPPPAAPSPSGPRSVPRVRGKGCSGSAGERAGGLQGWGWARPAAGGWGRARCIRGPGTAGWGLYFMRGRALAASPGSWGSGCYIKANNAAVVPSLPSPEVGRTGEPPNWTIIAHICWLTCAADGNSVCRLQRAAALVMEGTVKSGSGERLESGSRQPGDENLQPCGGD